ncbi:hypothetical protein BDV24DRAFT_162032 [Aspergillus arachidicola]|uniref:Uncharacterized protein n=1 Tax=Aspergillus arachidicola TaxID=656916 RepID=A0A2G7G6B9_9EURO|nr:hypothetical protein BDV24DRAFT_162032 [Aspergillus arachidicola]PIG87621.1 hypothetical protein AARAC_007232 [Aspergillus arachidicola]
MKFLNVLLLFYAALVASIPTANSNAERDISNAPSDALTVVCQWDWDCPKQRLCCKGRCHRTGDCKHVPSKSEVAGPQRCTWATDCRPGDLCCSGYCQSVYDCRRVPPKPPVKDSGDTADNKDSPETPNDAEPVVNNSSETQLDKRRYRSPEDKPNNKANDESSIQGLQTETACKQYWDCGVSGEHQWMCCNGKCAKWYPGSTPWIRPKCLK